jgi:hypothetical protein
LFSVQHLWPAICSYIGMILLITPSKRGRECADSIRLATQHDTHFAATLSEAVANLRIHEYAAIIFDECLIDIDPDQAQLVLQHIGTATPVFLNCAVTGTDRLIRDVKFALRRREKEQQNAYKAAEETLASDLREALTALLLECEMLLATPQLTPAVQGKLNTIDKLARCMNERLRVGALVANEH